jgi:F-type H+-transporting ATPase subunit epsilon
MRVVIAKVHENLFDGDAVSLTARTTEGEVTVLSKHEPFVASLAEGTVTVRTAEGERKFDVTGGVLEVSNNQATVLL